MIQGISANPHSVWACKIIMRIQFFFYIEVQFAGNDYFVNVVYNLRNLVFFRLICIMLKKLYYVLIIPCEITMKLLVYFS